MSTIYEDLMKLKIEPISQTYNTMSPLTFDTKSSTSLMDSLKSGVKKSPVKPVIPKVDIKNDKPEEPPKEDTTTPDTGTGDGGNIELPKIDLPDFDLPDVTLPDIPNTGIPDVPNTDFPEIDIPDLPDIPEIIPPTIPDIPEVVIPDTPFTDLPDVPNTDLPDIPKLPDVVVPEVDLNLEYNQKYPDMPKFELPKGFVFDPKMIDNIGIILPEWGLNLVDIKDDSIIREGDGKGYGEITIGDGIVIDAGKHIDRMYAGLTKGTPFENTNGRDLYDVMTNPDKFIKEKGIEKANEIVESFLGTDYIFENKEGNNIFTKPFKDNSGLPETPISQDPITPDIPNPDNSQGNIDKEIDQNNRDITTAPPDTNPMQGAIGTGVALAILSAVVSVCFSEDTLISTPTGLRKAKDLKVGDIIHSWDKGRISNTKLLGIIKSVGNANIIKTKTRRIEVSRHPIFGRNIFGDTYYMGDLFKCTIEAIKHKLLKFMKVLPMRNGVKLYKQDNTLEKVTSYKKTNIPINLVDFFADCPSSKIIGNGFILEVIPYKYFDKINKMGI